MNKTLLSLAIMAAVATAPAISSGMQSLMRVQALANGDAELLIYGPIGESWYSESVTAKSIVQQLQEIKATTIQVRINSEGGSVQDGLSIYNALKRHGAKIVVTVDGIAASIASLIAMAGDEVNMPENTLLMVHAPWAYAGGNAANLRETADILDTYADSMATSYVAKTGKSVEEINDLLKDGKDHWYTAAQAIAFGFADKAVAEKEEEKADEAAAASALLAYCNAIAKAPDNIQAVLRRRIQAGITPHIFSCASQEHQQAILANLEDVTMKQQYGQIMANAAGASAAANSQSTTAPAPVAAPSADVVAAANAAAIASLQARNTAITTVFNGMQHMEGVSALLQTCLADASMTADQANARLLSHLAANAGPLNTASRVEAGEDARDKIVNAGTQFLMARAGARSLDNKPVVMAGDNPFRGYTLIEMARASLVRAGIRTEGMDKRALVAMALTQSTSDFPIILENSLRKTLQAAYQVAPDTWSRFCKIGQVSDFREHHRVRTGSIGSLDEKNELGEFKTKNIPDGEKGSVTLKTRGNIIGISREAIINDDMGAFMDLAISAGRAGKRTIEAMVYTLLALNAGLGPVMSDSKTLFHADHGNLVATGTYPSVNAFDSMRVLMGKQTDVSGTEILGLRPAIWLGPLELGGDARVINTSENDPNADNKLGRKNKVFNNLRDIVDTGRLTGTPYYMFEDPQNAPVIEVAFLDGDQEPYLEQRDGWNQDGVEFKVRIDAAVGGIDYRGAVRNPGAAS